MMQLKGTGAYAGVPQIGELATFDKLFAVIRWEKSKVSLTSAQALRNIVGHSLPMERELAVEIVNQLITSDPGRRYYVDDYNKVADE